MSCVKWRARARAAMPFTLGMPIRPCFVGAVRAVFSFSLSEPAKLATSVRFGGVGDIQANLVRAEKSQLMGRDGEGASLLMHAAQRGETEVFGVVLEFLAEKLSPQEVSLIDPPLRDRALLLCASVLFVFVCFCVSRAKNFSSSFLFVFAMGEYCCLIRPRTSAPSQEY